MPRRFGTSSRNCGRLRPRKPSPTAKELVAEPIALSFQGQDVGTLEPARLAKLVRFRPDGDRFRITFAPDRIAKAVEPYWRNGVSAR